MKSILSLCRGKLGEAGGRGGCSTQQQGPMASAAAAQARTHRALGPAGDALQGTWVLPPRGAQGKGHHCGEWAAASAW